MPSPNSSNSIGEHFDLEWLSWRIEGNSLQVLMTSSMNPNTGYVYNGRTFHLGDVFMDVDGDGDYDYALTSGSWSTNLGPSYTHVMSPGLYLVDDTHVHGITSNGGYGVRIRRSPTRPILSPSTTMEPRRLPPPPTQAGLLGFQKGSYNYGTVFGANENGTWCG